jgi:hypothetical protein
MPNLSEISNGTKVILGAGILLLISTFLDWQRVEEEAFGFEVSVGETAWGTALGVIMGLALILLLVWVVLQVMNVKLNFELPITEAWLTLGLGVAVFGLALLKNLVDDYSAWPSYVGVVLAAGVALGAWLRAQELGGVTMARPSEMEARPSEPAPTETDTTPPTAPPPPPSSSSTDT